MFENLKTVLLSWVEKYAHSFDLVAHHVSPRQERANKLQRALQGFAQIWTACRIENRSLPAVDASAYLFPSWRFSSRRRKLLLVLAAWVIISLCGFLATPSGRKPLVLLTYSSSGPVHPISQLTQRWDQSFRLRSVAQSTTLGEAVVEYWRRYRMPPPPLFDEWYKFAVARGTELIDEFDTIEESLALFWSASPGTIRMRTRGALEHDTSLMGVSIRDGIVSTHGSGQGEFQASATRDMLLSFAAWLPDMDLAFNVNDEPRVLLMHEDIRRMLSRATSARRSVRPRGNRFTATNEIARGQDYERAPETTFNRLDHQATWSYASFACGPDTPARNLEGVAKDAEITFSFQGIDFVHDTLLYSDVCLRPSLRNVIGLFNHPNAFSVTHDLIPIFSPSKISIFGDILYPSPYYYAQKSRYDPDSEVSWGNKSSKLYWRGATSGGFSEGGLWKSLLRQSVLLKLTTQSAACTLTRNDTGRADDAWIGTEIPGTEAIDRYDAKFSEIKQCDIHDCLDMGNQLGHHPLEPQSNAWRHRYLLDMDGNALSGRFYALLQSRSLPLKVAFFREWHSHRIFPWKHFVPLSSSTAEYAEILRYFEEDAEGQQIAKDLAAQGRDWATRTLRRQDMEVYMFRLLLEWVPLHLYLRKRSWRCDRSDKINRYARLIDDNRSVIGYG